MGLKVEHFKDFSREVVYVTSKTKKEYILSLMRNQGVSLLPVIDNNGTKLVGYIKRKDLFFWFYDHPEKLFADLDIKEILKDNLESVDEGSYISDVMEKLTNRPAVLIRNSKGVYTHIISPRVAANALEKYSVAFREIEKIERYFKEVISYCNLSLDPVNEKEHGSNRSDLTINDLSFFNYIKIIDKQRDKLEINDDWDYVKDLMHKCRMYRNDLMHFKISVDTSRTKLLKSLSTFFLRNFPFLEKDEEPKAEEAFSKN